MNVKMYPIYIANKKKVVISYFFKVYLSSLLVYSLQIHVTQGHVSALTISLGWPHQCFIDYLALRGSPFNLRGGGS